MSQARAAILDRVRQALKTGYVPGAYEHAAAAQPCDLAPDKPFGAAEQRAGLVERFLAELTALGVDSYVESSPADVRARVAAIVEGRSVLSWDADRLPYDVGAVLTGAATGASPRDVQAAADVGVTGCDAALAETGTLVLLSGPGKPRAASLLPPTYVAIVEQGTLRHTMGDFFAEHGNAVRSAASCTFVTGPSRTADIELTLTLGVHGPGKVIVVVGP